MQVIAIASNSIEMKVITLFNFFADSLNEIKDLIGDETFSIFKNKNLVITDTISTMTSMFNFHLKKNILLGN